MHTFELHLLLQFVVAVSVLLAADIFRILLFCLSVAMIGNVCDGIEKHEKKNGLTIFLIKFGR